MAYSMDLRRRVVVAVEAGQAIAAVARRFSVCNRFTNRLFLPGV